MDGQGRELGPQQSALLHRRRQRRMVQLAAPLAAARRSLMFHDLHRPRHQLDLLHDPRRQCPRLQPPAAVRTAGQSMHLHPVDLRGGEGRAYMAFVARLPADLPFATSRRGRLGRFDDVARRRLGGVSSPNRKCRKSAGLKMPSSSAGSSSN
jgi:hypothetical protein